MTRKRSLHLMTTTTPKGGKNAQPNELAPKNSLNAALQAMNIKNKKRVLNTHRALVVVVAVYVCCC